MPTESITSYVTGEAPVYAIQHPDGYFVNVVGGCPMRFASAAIAKRYIDTLPCNGYAVVRYS